MTQNSWNSQNPAQVAKGGTGLATITSHGILLGNATGNITPTAEPTNGQVLIGKTGNFPVLATITAGSGISVTNGAGTISIASSATNRVVQQVYTSSGAYLDGTATIPFDDTIPQQTEGTEILTITITPTSATNLLYIVYSGNYYLAAGGGNGSALALFQDATANALSACPILDGSNTCFPTILTYRMVAGTTSATTFKVRGGSASGPKFEINGASSAARLYGGVGSSTFTITEYSV